MSGHSRGSVPPASADPGRRVAAASGRRVDRSVDLQLVPGDGDLDHSAWARALDQIGLDGVVSAEVIARPKGIPERWPLSYACERSMATFQAVLGVADHHSA